MAGRKFSPDCAPRVGGKIKLPAPKNIPNRSNPVKAPFLAINSPYKIKILS